MSPQTHDTRVDEISHLYDIIISTIAGSDGQVLGIDVRQVNNRIVKDVSKNISQPISQIKSTVNQGVDTAKDVASDTTTFPNQVSKGIADLPNKLGMDQISNIPSSINKLLAGLHTAIEDPSTLYPRLICCDVPVDPARIINFTKKYKVLEQLNQADITLEQGDRSLPTAPKSAIDVLTNINSSFETLSDTLSQSISNVTAIRENFDELAAATKDVQTAKTPIYEILCKQQDISVMVDQITSVFGDDDTSSRAIDRGLNDNKNALDFVQDASSLVNDMNSSSSIFDEMVPLVRNVGGTVTELAKNLKHLFSRGMELFKSFIAVLKRLVGKLPSMIRELQQFFLPSGLRELIMRPSNDLLSLLNSIETLKAELPNPENIQVSAREAFEENPTLSKVGDLKSKLETVIQFPQQLAKLIAESNLGERIIESVLNTLKKILDEMKGSVVGSAADLIGNALGLDNLSSNNGGGRKPGGFTGLFNNVTQGGGLFGKLF